ncbi:MAG: DUF1194 domain-containing protein [Pseudomonadota bacterium]
MLPASLAAPLTAKASTDVDLELVLAVDVSMSMDLDEQRHQREGYVAAFRSPQIVKAITSGPRGRIAVSYTEWAGQGSQSVVVPWRVIASAGDAAAFADELAAKPIKRALMTSISGALEHAAALFDANRISSPRRVIDVSGDGPNNIGGRVDRTRDGVVAKGIVINGLPLKFKRPDGPYSYFDLPDLDKYYAACVIGGPGSFMIAVQDRAKFGQAIRQKLYLEIADLQPPRADPPARIQRTQFRVEGVKPSYDCLAGEKRWQQYQLEQW